MEEPNFTYISQLSGGDKVFEEKIFKVLKMEFPGERETYLNNIISNNFDLAAHNVHKIKHKISLLGLVQSYELASEHEINLGEGNAGLHDNFNEVLKILTHFFDKI
ncbi:Hpt domain-containing protein [Flavobacterium sp. HJJ]|uniref:Hpt domain-containing protein n=1 Tax=Flavobacterium sp. HJJ TaxID=2783792 RepID=UPI00188A15C4|nr:Hpt domain-containing protein [Flavobacterium sp. HJJ]MBF4472115.1 Hpt domain-containing protein [Flavobacterium sp. HJJ]